MDTSALTTNCFNALCDFIVNVRDVMSDKRQRAVQKWGAVCGKLSLPIRPGSSPPRKTSLADQRAAIRAALVSMPLPICAMLPAAFLSLIDQLLITESQGRIVEHASLPQVAPNISIWQGDMSTLRCDAVVNPANNALLGCFIPTHKCLDNILHAQAGPRLRIACGELLQQLGIEEDVNGQCRVTKGFALPAQHVFHTVGPDLVDWDPYLRKPLPPRPPTDKDRAELTSCYQQCLVSAGEMNLRSLAFCCISTGVFGYPQQEAAVVAMSTVRRWMEERMKANLPVLHVVFNVFKDDDLAIYQQLAPRVFEGFCQPTGKTEETEKQNEAEQSAEAEPSVKAEPEAEPK